MITLSPWLIYFATLANHALVAEAILMIGALISFIWALADENKGMIKNTSILFSCLLIAFIFTPSRETIYKMMIIPTVVNSNVVQKLPDELQQYIDRVLSTKDSKQC